MIGATLWDNVMFVLASFGSILALVGLLRLLFSEELCNQAKYVLATLREHAVQGCSEVQHGEVGRIMNEKTDAIKLRQFRIVLQVLCVATVGWTMNVALNIVLQKDRINTLGQDLIMAIGQVHLSLVFIWPRLITLRNMDVHYCILVLEWSIAVSPFFSSGKNLVKAMLISNAWVALLAAARRTRPANQIPILAISNLGFACCVSSTILTHGTGIFTLPSLAVSFQFFIVGFMLVGAVSLEAGSRAIIYRSMELEEVKELHCAASAVLRSYCEVVVELDSDGYITASAGDLSSFLLRQTRMPGARLVDFIASEEDQQLFLERLEESDLQKTGLAENMQVTMRDGCNNKLRLELMWFQFRRRDQRRHFMLGIREFSDLPTQRAHSPAATVALHSCVVPQRSLEDATESTSDIEPATRSVCSSVPEEGNVSSVDTQDAQEAATPMITIDSEGGGMPIQAVSHGFCNLVGRLPLSVPVVKFIKNHQRFLTWVQLSLNAAEFGDESPTEPELPVTMKMPSGQLFKVTFRIVVNLGEEDEDLAFSRVGLLVVRVCRLRPHGHKFDKLGGPGSLRGTPSASQNVDAAKAVSL